MTIIQIQDKQIAAELRAIHKHNTEQSRPYLRSIIFAARTRAKNALLHLGLTPAQAMDAVTDAADMVALDLGSRGVDPIQRKFGREFAR